jgi:hypothetical protein
MKISFDSIMGDGVIYSKKIGLESAEAKRA